MSLNGRFGATSSTLGDVGGSPMIRFTARMHGLPPVCACTIASFPVPNPTQIGLLCTHIYIHQEISNTTARMNPRQTIEIYALDRLRHDNDIRGITYDKCIQLHAMTLKIATYQRHSYLQIGNRPRLV